MKVAHLSEPAEERVIFRDGLGVRERRDTGTGELVEWFHLDPAFASVEIPLRERVTRLAKLQHVKFSRILSLEPARKDCGPILVSSHVPGNRLSEVLEMAGHGLVTFEPGAGLQILRDVLSALAVLHDSRNVAHGSLAPERVVLTATGRVVMVEHVLGHALDRLQRPRHQLWREWRVPTPPAAGTVRFDMQTDFAQAGLLGLAVLLGRPIDEEEYPHRLRGLLPLVQDRLGRSPSAPIASDVVAVLERLAPVDSRRAFKTVRDAQQALEGLFSGGGAALGASPARVKSVVAAVAAIAAAEAPAASASDAAQAPATIVVAAPVTSLTSAAENAPARVQAPLEETASASEAEIDIEALLALEAELEDGSSPASPPPTTQRATGRAASATRTAPDAAPTMPAEDDSPLEALAQERLDLERQFAELVASVAPVSANETVHLIPETPATSEPLVDARVLWSSMPAADEAEPGDAIEPVVAPQLDEVVALPVIEAVAAEDDEAPVPFADTSVFSRLDVGAATEPLLIVATEEPRPTAAIEHVPAEWWKEALPWRDESGPDAAETAAQEPSAASEHMVAEEHAAADDVTAADSVADVAASGKDGTPVTAEEVGGPSGDLVDAEVASTSAKAPADKGDVTVLDLEPAAAVEPSIELATAVDAVAVVEETSHDDIAVVEDEAVIDVADASLDTEAAQDETAVEVTVAPDAIESVDGEASHDDIAVVEDEAVIDVTEASWDTEAAQDETAVEVTVAPEVIELVDGEASHDSVAIVEGAVPSEVAVDLDAVAVAEDESAAEIAIDADAVAVVQVETETWHGSVAIVEAATEGEVVLDAGEVVGDEPAPAPAPAFALGGIDVVEVEAVHGGVAIVEDEPAIENAVDPDAANVVDVVDVEPLHDSIARVEDEPAVEIAVGAEAADAVDVDAILADVAVVEDTAAIEVAAALDAVAVDARQDDAPDVEGGAAIDVVVIEPAVIVEPGAIQPVTTDVGDVPVFEAAVADATAGIEVETFHDEHSDATVAVDSDLELQPAATADDAVYLAPDADSMALAADESDARAAADHLTVLSLGELPDDHVTAVPFALEPHRAPEPDVVPSEVAVDAVADVTDAAAAASDTAIIATTDAWAVADVNVGGDDAMAPVGAYHLFGDIEPILLQQEDGPGSMQADATFDAQPVDDAPSFAAAALLSRDVGGNDARDWRAAFLGANTDADTPAVAEGGFFTGQTVAGDSEPEAEPIVEFEPIAEPAAESMDTASGSVDALESDDSRVAEVVCTSTDDEPGIPLPDAVPVVYASVAEVAPPSEPTTAPDAAPAHVEEAAPVDERAPVEESDTRAYPDPQPTPDAPLEPSPVEAPSRVEMPAMFPHSVPEVVIVDDGHDGNAWDHLPSELPEVTGDFGSAAQPDLAAESSAVTHEEDHHDSTASDLATSASASKKKKRRSRRKKGSTAVPTAAPAVIAAPATTSIPFVNVAAVANDAIQATIAVAPPVVQVAAAPSPLQAEAVPAPIVALPMAISLTPSDPGALTPNDDAGPEMGTRQASLLGREVPAWTPPSDFGALRPRGLQASANELGSTPQGIHGEPLAGEHEASTISMVTGHAGPTHAFAPASVAIEAPAPTPAPMPPASSFDDPEALRPFEQEIRAVGMPDLDELQPRSGRTNVKSMAEGLGTVTGSTSRHAAPSEPWVSAPAAQPEAARGINWRRFIAASVLIALFQGVAFAAWWWVQPGARGTLVVQTAKSGVEVLLDQKVVGRTPFREEVAPGRHTLGLRQGTNVREMPVEISVGVVTTQTLEWPSSTGGKGNLQLTSNPAGAQIVIDGKVRGTTPLLLENLPAGDQVLMLRGDAGSVTVKAMVVADETTPLEVKIFAGWVLVDAPVEVNLLLNGREKIGSSMDGQILLPPGTHRLRAVNEALGIRQWLTVKVEPGAVERVTFSVPPGTLTLPYEAEVFLDGASAGTTPGSIRIAPGTHEIVVRLADGTERRQTLTVRAGQRVEI